LFALRNQNRCRKTFLVFVVQIIQIEEGRWNISTGVVPL
jgi:hypothetical protein